jgi:uncharacterized membrane protein
LTANVEARPEDVYALFIDLERWPTMTASILEVRRTDSGPLRVGSEAVVKQPRLAVARWRVIELEPGRSFSWETKSAGVTTTGGHFVKAHGTGSAITLTLSNQGLLAGAINALLGNLMRTYMSMELEGFRQAAESRAIC